MTLAEILQGINEGRFAEGETLKCDGMTFKILSKDLTQVTFMNGQSEIWERLTFVSTHASVTSPG